MGVKLKDLVIGREIKLKELSGRTIAVDAFNWIYQFLTTIRLADGSYLTDDSGEITSHLNGLFYRTMNLLANEIMPIFVFDGPAPKFKKATNMERARMKEEAKKRAEEAKTEEERVMYMKRSVTINNNIISSSKELLSLMGVNVVQAPAEGEAQAAHINISGSAYGVASQDYDSLLFGATKLIRNLSITNRRKLPGKGISIEVFPQIIDKKAYESIGIDREQLILIALFIGTDYNRGVKGIGPKKALTIVKNEGRDAILGKYDFGCDYDIKEVFDYFLHPNVIDVTMPFVPRTIDRKKLIEFLSDKHSFSKDRMEAYLEKIKKEDSLLKYG